MSGNGITVGNVSNVIPFPTPAPGAASTPAAPTPGRNFAGATNSVLPAEYGLIKQTRLRVNALRDDAEMSKPDRVRAIFNYITAQEAIMDGIVIYADQQPYGFDGLKHRLYRVDARDAQFRAFLAVRYGLLPTEDLTRDVVGAMETFTVEQGLPREIRRFAYFDKKDEVLYLSRYNGDAWRIDGNIVTTVHNGRGVVFADDDGGLPCSNVTVGAHGVLFPHLIDNLNYTPTTTTGMSVDDQRCMFACWIFALALGELLPTKPLLLVEGEKGSGKTISVQRVQVALFGKASTMTVTQNGEEDFGVTLLQQALALIDNTDTLVEWLQDSICAYSTGGGWRRRQLYTNKGQVEIKPQAFIALATKNPATFRRDDVADRCLIMRLERRHDNFTAAEVLFGQILADRDLILGEYLYYLNAIVAEIRKGLPTVSSAYRMADFARLAHVIGPVLGFSSDSVDQMLQSMQHERDELTNERNPLTDLLDKWLEDTRNNGRSIRLVDLHSELSALAQKHHIHFYRTSKTLGKRLRDSEESLAILFKITHKDVAGTATYEIRRVKKGASLT